MAIQGFFTGDVKIKDLNGVLKAVDGIVEVATDAGTVTSVGLTVGSTGTDVNVADSPVTTSGNITLNLPTASATNRGLLSSADWAIFSAKQGTITLTTTGNNGSATLTSGTLNIPTYTLAGLGGISLTSLSASSPLAYNNITGAFSIQVANGSQNGYLSSSDWTTFNSKQSALTFSSPLVNNAGTVSIPAATSSVNGYLTSTDWATFNNKQGAITLTTTGSNGAATLIGTTLNIPNYSGALTGYVPYTGATTNVDLGEYELKAGQITLDTSPTGTAAVATTRWNNTVGVAETTLKGGNVILKNGVDLVVRVVNKVTPNTTLTKAGYAAVRVSGAQGQRLAIAYAQANNDNNSADTIGLVTETIATNQEGFVITVGELLDINTTGSLQGETWADGDVLYLSPTTPGALTNIKPNGSTGHIVVIGYVEYAHAIHGSIYVKVMNGWELDELHNVYISSPVNNQGLFYESATSLWKNKSIETVLGYTPANAATTLTINGTAYDLSASRTWNVGTVTSVGTSGPLTGGTITGSGTIGITQAGTASNGYLSSTDWNTFNNKQTALNGTGFIKISGTTISYDNSTYYLASNPSAYIALTALSATSPLSYNNITGVFSISQATTSTNGYLSSTDWNTFNNKQAAGNYITALTGEATASGPGSASVTLSTSAVTGKLLTGLNLTGGGSIAATDSILQAFGKVQNQISALVGGVMYQGVWNASTNSPTLTSSVGTKGYYYVVNVAGSTNLNGITDWKVGDWAIFNGSTWDKVDNTDAVSSVNGFTGAVNLTTSNIAEGTNLYYLDSRARLALSFTAGSGGYNNTTGVITIPTNTNQLTNGANYITLSSLSASSPLSYNNVSGAFSIQVANGSQNGYLSSSDWTTFNSKQAALTLTTTGSSGSSTLVGATLNVPTYTLSGLGGVPTTRTLTINGTSYDLSADRSWSVGTHTGSLTTGYVPKATGSTSLTDGLLYDTGSAVLIGTQTASTSKFMVYSATADNHYQAIGTAPSFRFADTIVSPTYTGIIGLATATNHFIIGAVAGDMVLANNTSSAGNFLFGTGATERMRINATTGNVSIGGTGNTYKLDVTGTGRFSGQLRLESTITNGTYTYTLPGATGTIALVGGAGVGTVTSIATTGPITGGTITSTGTIGITQSGAASDGYLSSTDWNTFNNKQAALTNPVTGTGTTNYLPKFTGTSTIGNSLLIDQGSYVESTANMVISNASTYRGLSITTTTASARPTLSFVNSNYAQYGSYIQDINGRLAFGRMNYDFGGHSEGMTLNASGNLSIGNTNDTYKLDVSGTGRMRGVIIDGANNANVAKLNWTRTDQSWSINNETNLRFYTGSGNTLSPSTQVLEIATSGAATFSSGVTAAQLYTNSNAGASGFLQFNYSSGNTSSRSWRLANDISVYGDFAIQQSTTQTGTTFANQLYINATGAATFSSTVRVEGSYLQIANATNPSLYINNTSVQWQTYVKSNNNYAISDAVRDVLTLGYNGSASYFNGCNVGIGTTSPAYKLEVSSSAAEVMRLRGTNGGSTNNTQLRFYGSASAQDLWAVGTEVATGTTSNAFDFYDLVAGANRLRITGSGNVGIGTTSPAHKLEVYSDGTPIYANSSVSYSNIRFGNTSASGGYIQYTGDNFAFLTASTERMRITSDGNLLINTTTNSGNKLEVNGTARFGSVVVGSLGTGLVYSNGGTLTSTNPSDQRLKNTIKPLSYGLNEILQLNPKTFYYNDDVNKERLKYGFIAQEVKGIMPELARKLNAETDYLGLETEGIYVTLVNAIKEQQAQINELKSQLNK